MAVVWNLDTFSLPIYQSPLLSSRDTVSTYEALSIIRKPAYHHLSVRWSDKQIRNRFLDFYLMFTRYLHPNYFNISGVCLIDAWSLVITSDDNTYGTEERHRLRENIDLSIKPPWIVLNLIQITPWVGVSVLGTRCRPGDTSVISPHWHHYAKDGLPN